MTGRECPRCGKESYLLSTLNRWAFVCRECDIRFDGEGQVMLPFDKWPPGYATRPDYWGDKV